MEIAGEIISLESFERGAIAVTKEAEVKGRFHLWRGQANASWDLTPKVFRTGPVDIDHEKRVLQAFWDQNSHRLTTSVKSMWDRLAVAQHYGAPTRLLDWTLDPYIGLWFALHDPSQENMPGRLWVTLFTAPLRSESSSDVDPFDLIPIAFWQPEDPALALRIERQRGWMSRSEAGQHSGVAFAAGIERRSGLRAQLYSWTIKSAFKSRLLAELEERDITFERLFPTEDERP